MIRVRYLKDFSDHYTTPGSRAAMLGHSALDFFRACAVVREYERHDKGIWLISFLLPTMHQTLELLLKAIAHKADASFNPRKYSHRTLDILQDYAPMVPAFSAVLSDAENVELLSELERAYMGVRYGECSLSYDGDAWDRFVALCELLFQDLGSRTGLRFPMGHWLQ